MNLEEYKSKVAEILQAPLTTDSPESVYKESAIIESLAYLAVRQAAELETKLSELNKQLRDEKEANLEMLTGTQMEKQIKLEGMLSPLLTDIEKTEAAMRYWRGVSKLIENKISLAQSILANITSQVKAGLYFNNIK